MILLALLILATPVIEIYVILQVGHAIGLLWTLALLVAMSAFGAWLVKREGLRAWTAVTQSLAEGRIPAREVADGALVLLGGALLLTPGFVTDALGVLLVLPPTRAVVRRVGLAAGQRRRRRRADQDRPSAYGVVIIGETVPRSDPAAPRPSAAELPEGAGRPEDVGLGS